MFVIELQIIVVIVLIVGLLRDIDILVVDDLLMSRLFSCFR